MTAHAWYIENRAAFVARSLERGEERTFRDHLVRCDECTREVARLERELGWTPRMPLAEGLEDTVRWYVDNYGWVERIRERGFHSDRLGLVKA